MTIVCGQQLVYNEDGALLYAQDDSPYLYPLYTQPDMANGLGREFTRTGTDVTVTHSYKDGDTVGTYSYPASIWTGRQSVRVSNKGIYRVSEVTGWSSTDYDFWGGSNQYKGYGETDKTGLHITDGYVIFSVDEVSGDKFQHDSDKITVEDTSDPDNPVSRDYYRPTASFTNSETAYAYLSSQSYAENTIRRTTG